MPINKIDPRTTALVLIDLQKGIARQPVEPRSGAEVVERGAELARASFAPPPPDFSEFEEALGNSETDIVLGGISTNMGVESTARQAHEHAYNIIFVKDAMASFSGSDHAHTVERTFPRIGKVSSTKEVLAAV